MKDSAQRIPLRCIEECKNIEKLNVLVERQKFLEHILKSPVLLPANYRKNIDYDLQFIQQHRKLLVDLKLLKYNINTLKKKLEENQCFSYNTRALDSKVKRKFINKYNLLYEKRNFTQRFWLKRDSILKYQ